MTFKIIAKDIDYNLYSVYVTEENIIIPGHQALEYLKTTHQASALEFEIWCVRGYIRALAQNRPDEESRISVMPVSHCGFMDSYFLMNEIEAFMPPSKLRIISYESLVERPFWKDKDPKAISNLIQTSVKRDELHPLNQSSVKDLTILMPTEKVYEEGIWPPNPILYKPANIKKCYFNLAEIEMIEEGWKNEKKSYVFKTLPKKTIARPTVYSITNEHFYPLINGLKNGDHMMHKKEEYVNAIYKLAEENGSWDLVQKRSKEIDANVQKKKREDGIRRALSDLKFQDAISPYKTRANPIHKRKK